MNIESLQGRNFEKEFIFKTLRSSGPGGQNVNKVNTKVELRVNIILSSVLSQPEKTLIFKKLGKRINSEGELIVRSQSERSQFMNKEKVIQKMYKIITEALTEDVERIATVPTKKSVIERLEHKRKRSSVKNMRKDLNDSSEE